MYEGNLVFSIIMSNHFFNGVPKMYYVAPLCTDRTMNLLLEV